MRPHPHVRFPLEYADSGSDDEAEPEDIDAAGVADASAAVGGGGGGAGHAGVAEAPGTAHFGMIGADGVPVDYLGTTPNKFTCGFDHDMAVETHPSLYAALAATRAGPRGFPAADDAAVPAPSPAELFQLFIPMKDVEYFLAFTNAAGAAKHGALAFRFITAREWYVWMGISFWMGVVKLPRISQYWDLTLLRAGTRVLGAELPTPASTPCVFRWNRVVRVCAGLSADKKYIHQYMSRDRWFQIKRLFRFVHGGAAADEEPEKRNYPGTTCPNPMWKVSPLLTRFVAHSQRYWRLSQNVCVDEAMMAAKGRADCRAWTRACAVTEGPLTECLQARTACNSSYATSQTASGSRATLQHAASRGTLRRGAYFVSPIDARVYNAIVQVPVEFGDARLDSGDEGITGVADGATILSIHGSSRLSPRQGLRTRNNRHYRQLLHILQARSDAARAKHVLCWHGKAAVFGDSRGEPLSPHAWRLVLLHAASRHRRVVCCR
jgi:hypothetical protein